MSDKPKDLYEKLIEDPSNAQVVEEDFDQFVASDEDIKSLIDVSNEPTKQREYTQKDHPIIPVEETQLLVSPKKTTDEEETEEDFQHSRDNLYNTMETIQGAMLELAQVAKIRQLPRDFEVLGLLGKTLTDATKALMDTHKKKQEIKNEMDKDPGEDSTTNYTQNNIYCSTEELDKFIRKQLGHKDEE